MLAQAALPLDVVLDTLSLGLGSLACAFLLRCGLVHTAVIAQFIGVALTFAYGAQVHFFVGLLAALATSLALVVASFATSLLNKRSYIIALYAGSLAAIPLGNLVLRIAAAPSTTGAATPQVNWGISPLATVVGALLAAGLALVALKHFHRSWRGVLLHHWQTLEGRSVRDMQIAGVFDFWRLARAGWPAAMAAAVLFVGAVLVGCFAQEGAYTADSYSTLPFIALLFALATKDRPLLMIVLIGIYGVISVGFWALVNRINLDPPFPIQGLLLIYGALFFLFSWVASRQEPAR